MLRQQGGNHVKAGFYLNLDSWEIRTISGGTGGILEGTSESRYLRVPVLGMLLFAPLMGALFAMFLPFIGIALMMQFAAGKARDGARHLAHQAVVALGPSWQPSAAHLTGNPDAAKEGKASPATAAQDAEDRLDALEQEIRDTAAR
jgi:hypothetical protein